MAGRSRARQLATRKTPAIKRWLLRHPRFPSALHSHRGLLNLVERWFAALTEKQLRGGIHRSTRELEAAIRSYLDINNRQPNPSTGPKPPTKSSDPSLVFVHAFQT
jgi:hypothetical protein